MSDRTYVGLDVHARSVVGCAIDAGSGEVFRRRMGADPVEVTGWVRSLHGQLLAGYEAGPTGYGLQRMLQAAGVDTVVLAPSKMVRPSGQKVKTDAADALLIAQTLAMGQYAAVSVPTVGQEGARDLLRARMATMLELSRARQRISKLLLRRGWVYPGARNWTKAHLRWLSGIRFPDDPLASLAYDTLLESLLFATSRLAHLDPQLLELAATSEYAPVMARLGCLRGISTLTGFGLAVEIGDWHRFTGSSIGAYVGLVPREHSSGGSRWQGAITKTGNAHARRLLIEAAWQHLKPYRPGSPTLQRRWQAASPAARERGHQGNLRLHRRWQKFTARNKNNNQANTAIARELAGWCWSLAVLDD